MPNTINIYDPRTMMSAIRQMPPVRTFLLDSFFTNIETSPTKTIDVDFYKGKRRLAPFVHPKIGGKTVANTGYKTNTFEPALVAPDTVTTADDLLKRLPGELLYGGMTPAERAAQKVGTDLADLDDMITRREEWMAAQALITGKIPVVGEGLNYEIDFNFTNKVTLSGTDIWSDTSNSNPIADLEEWKLSIQQNGFVNPDTVIMAHDAAQKFIEHPKVQNLLDNRRIELGTINPSVLPNGVTYIGHVNKLGVDIYEYNEWYLDDWTDPQNPTEAALIPNGTVIMASTRARFSRLYAAVTVIDEKTGQFVTVEASRVPESWVEKKPARRFIQISSKPLTVPHEVNSWYVATVL